MTRIPKKGWRPAASVPAVSARTMRYMDHPAAFTKAEFVSDRLAQAECRRLSDGRVTGATWGIGGERASIRVLPYAENYPS